MISSDDAELAALDPALPGLRTVLDDDALRAALAGRLPERGFGAVHLRYARWKPEHSAVVGYVLELDGAELWAYGRAYTRSRFARLEARLSRAEDGGGPFGPSIVALADEAVAMRAFCGDRRLPALSLLADGRARAELLAEAVPGRPGLGAARLEPLRYWPERRFVARLGADGEQVLLKAYTERLYPPAATAAGALQSGGALRLAGALGRSDRHRMLAFEWLPGRALGDALGEPEIDSELPGAVAAALAELHGRPGASLPREDPRAEARLLERRAIWVGRVREDVAAPARALADRLAPALEEAPSSQAVVHGDFSPNQLIVEAGSVSVIDLDNARRAPPEADLGTFLAHLEARVLAGGLSRERADTVSRALLDGYRREAGAVDGRRLRVRVAAGMLGRAASGFRNRTPGWRGHLPGLVERAERILDEGLE